MKLFAGIDGGQSSTVAIVADENGAIVGRGVAGPADHIGEPENSMRFARAIEAALARALQSGGLREESELDAIVAGVSGYEGRVHGAAPTLHARRVRLVHDAPIAHAGAFALEPGIVVIAGTGSVAYGVDADGRNATVGGWGFLFGDEGSAFDIARRALARAMRADDEGRRSPLAAAALHSFGAADLRGLARAFYTGKIDRPALAAFAPVVLRLAADDESDAAFVTGRAARALAELTVTCAQRLALSSPPVALAGGLFASERFRELVAGALGDLFPSARAVIPRYDPPTGALLLAYKEAGVQLPARLGPVGA